MTRVAIERLSPEHQEYLAHAAERVDHFKKPKADKLKLMAYGETFKTQLELDYANYLETWRKANKIDSWLYEPLRFSLGLNVSYTPDFLTVQGDDAYDSMRNIYEVKGSWLSRNARDSRTRLKIAATMYQWFNWYAVTREKGVWKFETIRENHMEDQP